MMFARCLQKAILQKILTVVVLLVLPTSFSYAQLNELWVHFFALPDTAEIGEALAIDPDGNLVMGGFRSAVYGEEDFVVAKFDSEGNVLWSAFYDHTAGESDFLQDITTDSQGNVIITGRAEASGAMVNENFVTVKYDSEGNQLWVGDYDGGAEQSDRPAKVATDSDDNILVGGRITTADYASLIALVKYAPDGTELWASQYETSPASYAYCPAKLMFDTDNNIFYAGNTRDENQQGNFALVQFLADGSIGWSWEWDNGGSETLIAAEMRNDGSIVVAGGYGTSPDTRFKTIALDINGNEIWNADFPQGTNESNHTAVGMAVDANNNVYVTGSVEIPETYERDWVTAKFDADGNLRWSVQYDGPTDEDYDQPYKIICDNDGNVIVTGQTGSYSAGYLNETHMYDTEGNGVTSAILSTGHLSDRINDIAVDTDNNIYLSGYTEVDDDTTMLFMLVKYGEESGLVSLDNSVPQEFKINSAWPNPFNSIINLEYELSKSTSLSLEVYDMLGRKVDNVYSGSQSAGNYKVQWNAGNLASGQYVLVLRSGHSQVNRKITYLK